MDQFYNDLRDQSINGENNNKGSAGGFIKYSKECERVMELCFALSRYLLSYKSCSVKTNHFHEHTNGYGDYFLYLYCEECNCCHMKPMGR